MFFKSTSNMFLFDPKFCAFLYSVHGVWKYLLINYEKYFSSMFNFLFISFDDVNCLDDDFDGNGSSIKDKWDKDDERMKGSVV